VGNAVKEFTVACVRNAKAGSQMGGKVASTSTQYHNREPVTSLKSHQEYTSYSI